MSRIFESGHSELHYPIGEQRPVEQENRRGPDAECAQHYIECRLNTTKEHLLYKPVHGRVVTTRSRLPSGPERRAVRTGQHQRNDAAGNHRRAFPLRQEQRNGPGEHHIDQDGIEVRAVQLSAQRTVLGGERREKGGLQLRSADPPPLNQTGRPTTRRCGADHLGIARKLGEFDTARSNGCAERGSGEQANLIPTSPQIGRDSLHGCHMPGYRTRRQQVSSHIRVPSLLSRDIAMGSSVAAVPVVGSISPTRAHGFSYPRDFGFTVKANAGAHPHIQIDCVAF
ncbi:hypothetical protein [Nocardia beijingensis]|uniref:hypothetical protein n=1 Tax=Nocardia beijingensis TaxID=95162 RepID=UPI001FD29488|nr:hypothetical protein [Nocardia beijingensis]